MYKLLLLVLSIMLVLMSEAQEVSLPETRDAIAYPKLVEAVHKKVQTLQQNVEKNTLKTLHRLQKQELKLQKKLALKDSVAAKALFAENKYQQYAQQLQHPPIASTLKEYIPQFDSLKTSLQFLEQSKFLTSKLPIEYLGKLKTANISVAQLEGKLQQAVDIKQYIKERKQILKAQLEKFGMLKDLKKLNKEAYYYTQQLNEYKAILKDPKKIEQRALTELRKFPAFTDFMKRHSQLAQLFRLPDNYGTPASLAGLQTRASIQGILQQRFASDGGGMNPQQYINTQVQQAQGELTKLKDKLNKLGGGNSDIEIPEFNPNSQKTKSFLKRLEFGANVQTQKTNGWLPVTSDFALTTGYKLNDKSIIGIGGSYKMGWGSGINNIRISHQGMGIRSYVDMKLKGSFWISGGYEKNYQHSFSTINELKTLDKWQSSGLLGLTKKYKIGKKTNNLQLLWDFLSYQQIPRTQPILFRVGYAF